MKAWLLPLNSERRYQRLYRTILAEVKVELLARTGDIIRLQNGEDITKDEYYTEAKKTVSDQSDKLAIAVTALMLWWKARSYNVFLLVRILARDVNIFNDNQFRLVVKDISKLLIPPSQVSPLTSNVLISPYQDILKVFGSNADVFRQEPYLDGIEKNFNATQETHLNKTISSVISDSEIIIRNALIASTAAKIIKDRIDSKFITVTNASENFAKDQVNKLDSVLTKERQKSFGSEEYKWQTMEDNRVRGNPYGLYPRALPSHYARNQQIFRWDSPPIGGHPGEDYGCRCRAVMKLPKSLA